MRGKTRIEGPSESLALSVSQSGYTYASLHSCPALPYPRHSRIPSRGWMRYLIIITIVVITITITISFSSSPIPLRSIPFQSPLPFPPPIFPPSL